MTSRPLLITGIVRHLETASDAALEAAHKALTTGFVPPPPPPPCGLTPRQRETLDVIIAAIDASGSPPSYAEIGAALGVVKSDAHRMVERLEERGWVRREPNRNRGLTVLHRPGDGGQDHLEALTDAARALKVWIEDRRPAASTAPTPDAIQLTALLEDLGGAIDAAQAQLPACPGTIGQALDIVGEYNSGNLG